MGRLELPLGNQLVPKTSASTNFATFAFYELSIIVETLTMQQVIILKLLEYF